MNPCDRTGILEELGVAPSLLGEAVALPPLDPALQEGASATQAGAVLWALLNLLPGVEVRRDGAHPDRFKVSGVARTGTDLRVAGPASRQDLPEDEAVFVVPEGGAAYVGSRSGAAVVIRHDASGFTVEPLLHIRAFAEVTAPVLEWTAGNPWLTKTVQECLVGGTNWSAVAAAGVVSRYRPVAQDAAGRAEAMRLLLAGEEPFDPKPAAWMAGLRPEQMQTVSDLAAGQAERVSDLLERLEERMDPDSEEWREDLRWACLERDELEGVRNLVHKALGLETVSGNRRSALRQVLGALEERLALLDQDGESMIAGLPVRVRLQDSRLERMARHQGDAWWLRSFA